jgi:hypothetical protein
MEEENGVARDLQRVTEGLEEGLETCQKIVSDYRSALLNLNGQNEAPHDPEIA